VWLGACSSVVLLHDTTILVILLMSTEAVDVTTLTFFPLHRQPAPFAPLAGGTQVGPVLRFRIRIHRIDMFLASRIRIHYLEVWILIRIWLRIPLSSCKNNKKNLDSYYFVTDFDFLSLKNYVNVPSKSNQQKI
jgi:hypothetical protein